MVASEITTVAEPSNTQLCNNYNIATTTNIVNLKSAIDNFEAKL